MKIFAFVLQLTPWVCGFVFVLCLIEVFEDDDKRFAKREWINQPSNQAKQPLTRQASVQPQSEGQR